MAVSWPAWTRFLIQSLTTAGLTTEELTTALCIDLPSGSTLEAYDALGDAVTGSAHGLAILKTNVELANWVTAGSNLLTIKPSKPSTYASYAILMDQSIAKQVRPQTEPMSAL